MNEQEVWARPNKIKTVGGASDGGGEIGKEKMIYDHFCSCENCLFIVMLYVDDSCFRWWKLFNLNDCEKNCRLSVIMSTWWEVCTIHSRKNVNRLYEPTDPLGYVCEFHQISGKLNE